MAQTRKLVFGLITVLVIPALFFTTLEMILRLAGYGKSYDYFAEIKINGRSYFLDNPGFIEQFYPAALNLTPLENTFSSEKPDDLIRIFVLGGSAARGFPNPPHGFSRLLETQLRQALPGMRVEVINTSMTAVNSHVVYEIARSIPKGAADFAIVLMGNNEVVGPYGPGTLYQNFSSNLDFIRTLQAIKRLRIGQGISDLANRIVSRNEKAELAWLGMQMFVENKVLFDDPRLDGVYAHFQRNLEDIIRTLQHKGAHVLLSTVPVNLRNSAPFASAHNPGLSASDLQNWSDAFSLGNDRYDEEKWLLAIEEYEKAESIDPDHADTHYRLGVAYATTHDYQKAAGHLNRARDLDALRFRADSRINDVIRDVANQSRSGQLTFVDSESMFSNASQPGLPGWNLFLEHVHFNFKGNYLLANGFSAAIMETLGKAATYSALPEAELARRTGYPNDTTIDVMKKLVDMVQSPPFTGSSNRFELRSFLTNTRSRMKEEVGSVADQISRYREVLQHDQGDWRLRLELAKLLQRTNDRSGAYEQLKHVLADFPHDRGSHLMMATMLYQDRRFREEISHLKRALKYTRGDKKQIALIKGSLGVAYSKAGDPDTAIEILSQVAHNNREDVQTTLNAYEELIRIARSFGRANDVNTFAKEVQQYGETMLSTGQDNPGLHRDMARILRLAGLETRAQRWLDTHGRPGDRSPGNMTR
jgi:tetratricopeptide (TPR) repeat protein